MVTVPFAGRWRLFARCYAAGPTDFTVVGSGPAASDPTSTVVDWVEAQIVDLGVFTFPKGNMPSGKPYTLSPIEVGIDVGGPDTFTFGDRFHVDYIVAVPLDLPLDQRGYGAVTNFLDLTTTSGDKVLRLDAEREAVQEIAAGAYGVASLAVPSGRYLQVTPGATNVLTVLPRRGGSAATGNYKDQISDTTTLTLTYSPRWLYLASS